MAVHEGHIVGEILIAVKTGAGNPPTHGVVATQVSLAVKSAQIPSVNIGALLPPISDEIQNLCFSSFTLG